MDDDGRGAAARRDAPSDDLDGDVSMVADTGSGTQAEVCEAADEDVQEEGPQEPPSVEQLRADFEQQKQVVAMLEKMGRADDDQTLAAARAQRDDAKAAWDSARNAPPHYLRLRWAEQALDKARRSRDRAEQDIRTLDEEHERKRKELCTELEQRRLKFEMRQEKVDEIRLEVGALAGKAKGKGGGGKAPMVGLLQEIDNVIGPELTNVVGSLAVDSEPFKAFNLVLDKLQDACGAAAEAVHEEAAAEQYDIGDAADDAISDISDTVYVDGVPVQKGGVKGKTDGEPSPPPRCSSAPDSDSPQASGAIAYRPGQGKTPGGGGRC